MNLPLVAVIISATAFLFQFLIQLVVTVWWASKVNTVLGQVGENFCQVRRDLEKIGDELVTQRLTFLSKDEATREFAILEKNNTSLWGKVDGLKVSVTEIEKNVASMKTHCADNHK